MENRPNGNVVSFLEKKSKEITKHRKKCVNAKYIAIYCIYHLNMENVLNGNVIWFLVKENHNKNARYITISLTHTL